MEVRAAINKNLATVDTRVKQHRNAHLNIQVKQVIYN